MHVGRMRDGGQAGETQALRLIKHKTPAAQPMCSKPQAGTGEGGAASEQRRRRSQEHTLRVKETQTACMGCYRHKEIHQHAVLYHASVMKFIELSCPADGTRLAATARCCQWSSVKPGLAAAGTSCVLWCSLKPLLTNFDTTAACACTREAKHRARRQQGASSAGAVQHASATTVMDNACVDSMRLVLYCTGQRKRSEKRSKKGPGKVRVACFSVCVRPPAPAAWQRHPCRPQPHAHPCQCW